MQDEPQVQVGREAELTLVKDSYRQSVLGVTLYLATKLFSIIIDINRGGERGGGSLEMILSYSPCKIEGTLCLSLE